MVKNNKENEDLRNQENMENQNNNDQTNKESDNNDLIDQDLNDIQSNNNNEFFSNKDKNEEDNNENEKNNEDSENEEDNDFDFKFISQKNKHKLPGSHSLNRDVLFTGKDDDIEEEEDDEDSQFNEEISIKTDSIYEQESKNHPEYMNRLSLEQDVFELLKKNTNIDFTENRRKPRRETFNHYYEMLIDNLRSKYTKSEIFVTLAYYFTDNIFNMFKLLKNTHATKIIEELKEKGYLDSLDDINFV